MVTPAMERRIEKGVVQRSTKTLSDFASLDNPEDVFYDLPGAAFAALNLERDLEAADLARRSIASAAAFEQNWNYANALHTGHTVLGLLSLKDGNVPQVIEELQASADVSGSPQLNSFGPSMQLARQLLLRGRTAEVLEFFNQCRQFWASGGLWLDIWTQKVKSGRVPNFLMNLYR